MEYMPVFQKEGFVRLSKDKISLPLAMIYEVVYIVFLLGIAMDSGTYDKLLGKSIFEWLLPYVGILLLPIVMISPRGFLHRRAVYILFSIILLWALASLAWSSLKFDLSAIVYPLYMAWLSMSVAFIFTYAATFRGSDWEQTASRLAWVLTAIFLYYLYKYSLAPGGIAGLGEHRLRGRLGGAAVLHFIMLPVLAVHFANAIRKSGKMTALFSWAGVIVMVLLILLTGSRAGLLSMLILIASLFFSARRSFLSYITVTALGFGTYMLVNSLFSLERLGSLEDTSRQLTYMTGWKYATSSWTALWFGNGYGSIWPWYAIETEKMLGIRSVMQNTEWGSTLYHPHSLLLGLLSELGLVSVVAFAGMVIVLIRVHAKAKKQGERMRAYLSLGMLCTLPATFMDYYLFKSWDLAFIWWTFLFLAVAVPKGRSLK
jgi:O-antigen ligase